MTTHSANTVSYSDYYPYGMLLPGRHGEENTAEYRYGFQGQEIDDEVNYKYRMHDPRIGRFFAVDPLSPKYPEWTPYAFSGNQVTVYAELEGLEPEERLDENGNVIQPELNEVRAGVSGGSSDNNLWRAYRYEKTGTNTTGWVPLGELRMNNKFELYKKASDVLPIGVSDVEIQRGGDDYYITSFRLKDGTRYSISHANGNTPNDGFWSSAGGKYSGLLNDDREYIGDLYTNEYKTAISVSDVENANLNYLDLVKIQVGHETDEIIAAVKDKLLAAVTNGRLGGGIDPVGLLWSYNNAFVDKKIRAALVKAGPGSYYSTEEVNLTRMVLDSDHPERPYTRITHIYFFKGYYEGTTPVLQYRRDEETVDPKKEGFRL